jgi:hypothetical protein
MLFLNLIKALKLCTLPIKKTAINRQPFSVVYIILIYLILTIDFSIKVFVDFFDDFTF